jgi:hypothetical protein
MACAHLACTQKLAEDYPLHYHPSEGWGYLVPKTSTHVPESPSAEPFSLEGLQEYNFFKLPNKVIFCQPGEFRNACAFVTPRLVPEGKLWKPIGQGLHPLH